MPNVNILYGSRIGNNNRIFPGAVIGAIPQDLKFRGEETTAEIGDNNTIRENVTINRGTAAKGKTIVGNNNLLMGRSTCCSRYNCRKRMYYRKLYKNGRRSYHR